MTTRSPQTVIRASAIHVADLFAQGAFHVPWHQRYYDWEARDVSALLTDIHDAIKDDRDCYFLGTVMLLELSSQQWEINDGQQRMVTLSLICAALCERFNRNASGSQRERFALQILFQLHTYGPASFDNAEQYTPRITPPRNDQTAYYQLISGNPIGSNGKLANAWQKITDFFAELSMDSLESYFDFICNKLEVVCLYVPLTIDPNAIYEAINCRGKKLVEIDLVRNYLYSHFNIPGEEQRKRIVHDGLERIKTIIPHQGTAFEFVRCILQCKFGFLPKEGFYRYARTRIEQSKRTVSQDARIHVDIRSVEHRNSVFKLTGELTSPELLALFRMIRTPSAEDEFISAFLKDSQTTASPRNLAVYLFELSGYTVTQSLVFSMLELYINTHNSTNKRRMAKLINKNLSRLSAFVMRTAFVAPKFEPSRFEKEFARLAEKISSKRDPLVDDFANCLKEIDPVDQQVLNDRSFRDAIRDIHLKGGTKVKQFLIGINRDMQQDGAIIRASQCSIEHIFPKSSVHWAGWTKFRQKKINAIEWVDRIGNLTLVARTSNKSSTKFNESFEKKAMSFRNSAFEMTRELSHKESWGPVEITRRESELVSRALKVWRFQ